MIRNARCHCRRDAEGLVAAAEACNGQIGGRQPRWVPNLLSPSSETPLAKLTTSGSWNKYGLRKIIEHIRKVIGIASVCENMKG
jgi:hypothetical protein